MGGSLGIHGGDGSGAGQMSSMQDISALVGGVGAIIGKDLADENRTPDEMISVLGGAPRMKPLNSDKHKKRAHASIGNLHTYLKKIGAKTTGSSTEDVINDAYAAIVSLSLKQLPSYNVMMENADAYIQKLRGTSEILDALSHQKLGKPVENTAILSMTKDKCQALAKSLRDIVAGITNTLHLRNSSVSDAIDALSKINPNFRQIAGIKGLGTDERKINYLMHLSADAAKAIRAINDFVTSTGNDIEKYKSMFKGDMKDFKRNILKYNDSEIKRGLLNIYNYLSKLDLEKREEIFKTMASIRKSTKRGGNKGKCETCGSDHCTCNKGACDKCNQHPCRCCSKCGSHECACCKNPNCHVQLCDKCSGNMCGCVCDCETGGCICKCSCNKYKSHGGASRIKKIIREENNAKRALLVIFQSAMSEKYKISGAELNAITNIIISDEIFPTQDLREFKKSLLEVDYLDREEVLRSLCGEYKTALAREMKSGAIRVYNYIASSARKAAASAGKLSKHLHNIASAFDDLINVINSNSPSDDAYVSGGDKTEHKTLKQVFIEHDKPKTTGGDATGGANFKYGTIAHSSALEDFRVFVREFARVFDRAHIIHSMREAAKSITKVTEEYTDMVAREVAGTLEEYDREYQKNLDYLEILRHDEFRDSNKDNSKYTNVKKWARDFLGMCDAILYAESRYVPTPTAHNAEFVESTPNTWSYDFAAYLCLNPEIQDNHDERCKVLMKERMEIANGVRKMIKSQHRALHDIYPVFEYLDKVFGSSIHNIDKHPGKAMDILRMVNTKMATNWYSEDAGEVLADLFDCFPCANKMSDITVPDPGHAQTAHTDKANDNGKVTYDPSLATHPGHGRGGLDAVALPFADRHKGDRPTILAANKLGRDRSEIAHNIDEKDPDMREKYTKHYYDKVFESLYGKDLATREDRATDDYTKWPGCPFLGIHPENYKGLRRIASDAMDQIIMLKNIVKLFFHVCELDDADEMHKVYDAIRSYVIVSAFCMGNTEGSHPNGLETPIYHTARVSTFATQNHDDAIDTVRRAHHGHQTNLFNYVRPFNMPYGIRMDNCLCMQDTLKSTNRMFIAAIQGMCGRIMAEAGLNSVEMFGTKSTHGLVNPIRMILGGAGAGGSSTPVIYAEHARIYPQLFKFLALIRYLVYNELKDTNAKTVSIIRSRFGIFGPLADEIIFSKLYGGQAEPTRPTDTQVRTIIIETNRIIDHYKHEKKSNDLLTDIILGAREYVNENLFIASVRKLKKLRDHTDRDLLKRDKSYGNLDSDTGKYVNHDILGDESPFPADRIESESAKYLKDVKSKRGRQVKVKLQHAIWQTKMEFCERLKNLMLTVPDPSVGGMPSAVDDSMFAYEQSLANTSEPERRMKIVAEMIQGSGVVHTIDSYKMFTFHEMVIAPLNMLTAMYGQMRTFVELIDGMDLGAMHHAIDDYLTKYPTSPALQTYATRLNSMHAAVTGTLASNGPNAKFCKYMVEGDMLGGVCVLAGTYGPIQTQTDITFQNLLDRLEVLLPVKATQNKEWISAAGEIFKRFGINNEYVLYMMIKTIYKYAADINGLVRYNVTGNQNLTINYGPLREVVSSTLIFVDYALRQFRGVVDKSIIARYAGSSHDDVGSLTWLNHHFLDTMLEARTGNELTLARAQAIIGTNIDLLKRSYKFTVDHICGNTALGLAAPTAGASISSLRDLHDQAFGADGINYVHYGDVFAQLAYHNTNGAVRRTLPVLLDGTRCVYKSVGEFTDGAYRRAEVVMPWPLFNSISGTLDSGDHGIAEFLGQVVPPRVDKIDATQYFMRHAGVYHDAAGLDAIAQHAGIELYKRDNTMFADEPAAISHLKESRAYRLLKSKLPIFDEPTFKEILKPLVGKTVESGPIIAEYYRPDHNNFASDLPEGVVYLYNDILAKYIETFASATGKIYKGVIQDIASGIYQTGRAICDIGVGMSHLYYEFEENTSMCASLAYTMRTLVTAKNARGVLHFLENDLSASTLSAFTIKNYQANMPLFIKLAEQLRDKIRLIDSFLRFDFRQRRVTKSTTVKAVSGFCVGHKVNPRPQQATATDILTYVESSEMRSDYINSMLSSVTTAVNEMRSTCRGVLAEISYNPKLFEGDSITMLGAEGLTFSPISMLTYALRDLKEPVQDSSSTCLLGVFGGAAASTRAPPQLFQPLSVGSNVPLMPTKQPDVSLTFLHGSHAALFNYDLLMRGHDEIRDYDITPKAVDLERMPYVNKMLDAYNRLYSGEANRKIEVGRFGTFVKNYMQIARYVTDCRFHRSYLNRTWFDDLYSIHGDSKTIYDYYQIRGCGPTRNGSELVTPGTVLDAGAGGTGAHTGDTFNRLRLDHVGGLYSTGGMQYIYKLYKTNGNSLALATSSDYKPVRNKYTSATVGVRGLYALTMAQDASVVMGEEQLGSYFVHHPDMLQRVMREKHKEAVERITKYLEKTSTMNTDVMSQLIYNLLDLNVVPFTFTAFSKQLSFVNTYNLQHGYLQLVAEMHNLLGYDYKYNTVGDDYRTDVILAKPSNKDMVQYPGTIDAADTYGIALTADELMYKLQVNPYAPIFNSEYKQLKLYASGVSYVISGQPAGFYDAIYGRLAFGTAYEDIGALSVGPSRPDGTGIISHGDNHKWQIGTTELPQSGPRRITNDAYRVPTQDPGEREDVFRGLTYLTTQNGHTMLRVVPMINGNPGTFIDAPTAGATAITDNRHYLTALGMSRMNTVLVRNLMMFINAQRIMRHQLRNIALSVDRPVASGLPLLADQITDHKINTNRDRNIFTNNQSENAIKELASNLGKRRGRKPIGREP